MYMYETFGLLPVLLNVPRILAKTLILMKPEAGETIELIKNAVTPKVLKTGLKQILVAQAFYNVTEFLEVYCEITISMTRKITKEYFSQTSGLQLKLQRSYSAPGAVEEAVGLQVRTEEPSLTQPGEQRLKGDFRITTKGRADGLLARTGSLNGHPSKQQPRSTIVNGKFISDLKDDLLILAQLSNKLSALEEENDALRRKQAGKIRGKLKDYNNSKQVVWKICVDTLVGGDLLWVNRAHQLGRDRSTIIAHIPDDGDIEH
ncbi:hypothetical protein J6590_032781 [Homalodisca vitripennis]|nr:hypothetical protein J6590_032781 [Homalodisca vitripennis]